eukprot:352193-Chlamydomonas_euryale.AAC.20
MQASGAKPCTRTQASVHRLEPVVCRMAMHVYAGRAPLLLSCLHAFAPFTLTSAGTGMSVAPGIPHRESISIANTPTPVDAMAPAPSAMHTANDAFSCASGRARARAAPSTGSMPYALRCALSFTTSPPGSTWKHGWTGQECV